MPVTQKDIAQRLGISHQIVGQALNGHPRVAEQTRQRVREVAEELGYRLDTNQAARAMAKRRHGKSLSFDTVAVLWPHAPNSSLRTLPYYAALLDGLEMEADARGTDVVLSSVREGHLPRLVRNGEIDGVIVLTGEIELDSLGLVHPVPVVRIGVEAPSSFALLPDEEQGGYLATKHLLELGHRRIGYVGHTPEFAPSHRRIAGYQRALLEAGIQPDAALLETTLRSQEYPAEAVDALLSRVPDLTAAVCHNDVVAMSAIRHLEQQGLRVPEDISVTGFDDISAEYRFQPAVTSVRFDRIQMGRRAVQLIYQSSTEAVDTPAEIFPVELAVSDSSAAPRSLS